MIALDSKASDKNLLDKYLALDTRATQRRTRSIGGNYTSKAVQKEKKIIIITRMLEQSHR